MVIVTCPDGIKFYQDGRLNEELQKVKKRLNFKDYDHVALVDGAEGSGKSVFSMQLAKSVDQDFCLDRLCMTPTQFIKAVKTASKGQAIIFDEAYTGLSSRGALKEINNLLVALMMEMRQKNLFVIIVLPTFFLLDKYVALFRARGLFHVYLKEGKRGQWTFYNDAKKRLLYLSGKKLYSYGWPKSSFKGRFLDQYTIDETDYRAKKAESFGKKKIGTRSQTWMNQRNGMIYLMNKEDGISQLDIVERLKSIGMKLEQKAISDAITSISADIAQKKAMEGERISI